MGKRIKKVQPSGFRYWILEHTDELVIAGIYLSLLLIIAFTGRQQ